MPGPALSPRQSGRPVNDWAGIDDLFEDGPEVRRARAPAPAMALSIPAAPSQPSEFAVIQPPPNAPASARRPRPVAARPWGWALAGFAVGIAFWHFIGFWKFVGDIVYPQFVQARMLVPDNGPETTAAPSAGGKPSRSAKPRLEKPAKN